MTLERYKYQKQHDLSENRPFLCLYDYFQAKQSQNFGKKEDFKEKEEKRVIIIDMVNPDTGICQIELQ
tara:strand:+ start:1110 stop:1313 length:204 start_codon:yes stop_codon:yes gene_type:complete